MPPSTQSSLGLQLSSSSAGRSNGPGLAGRPAVALRTRVRYYPTTNMRTLQTQVKLRRLLRAVAEAQDRLESEPRERRLAGVLVDRLLELSADVQAAWRRESAAGRLEPALGRYVASALRTVELA